VVVRDALGHAVRDLRKDDFELLDNGQPQTISSFSVESPAAANQQPVPAPHATNELPAAHAAAPPPDHYVMYLVDDLDLEFGDLSQTRSAAERVLRDSPDSVSRVGVLSTSGRVVLDFTSDQTRVDDALNRIAPQGRAAVHQCPDLSYYLADRIVRFEDKQAIALATRKAQGCGGAVSGERTAELAAEQAVSQYRAQTKAAVAMLKAAARQMSILPGSRAIVLVSPGFITPDLESEVNDAIDTAVRAGVVINTLDARGVWVLPGFDAATAGMGGPPEDNATRGQNAPGSSVGAPEMDRIDRQYAEQAQQAQSDVLIYLAEGTGGSVSHGNDFEAAFRRLTAAPEVSYVLGFTPTKLKPDGSFHKLKVTVIDRKGLTVQARNGYFAPKHELDAAEQAKEEIENAVFSRAEIQDIPVTLKTQVSQGKLSAIAHFGIGGIRFVNKDGHHRSSVTATVSLFEAGGKYLKGVQDIVNLDFPDDKLASAIAAGEAIRADFDAPAGSYVVRLVLRDSDGHMSSISRLVDSP
jgi:VWFA-related protein